MENNLERLEQIMKPYFDKQNEIEALSTENENEANRIKEEIASLKAKRKEERIKLELRLERLRANKDREIEEYVSSQPSFYAGYAATVRKDLEQAYKAQEDELIAEIKSFDATTEKQISNLENSINSQPNRNYFVDMTDAKDLLNNLSADNQKLKEINSRPNYKRVYLREMIDVKNSLRKPLIAEQKEISYALQKEKINFDSIMLELSNFKYQYNDQHQVTNGLEWKELYEKSNQISSKINELRNSLKVVEEYLNLTELTKDEIAAAMSSLAPWEKAEYDRRNSITDSHDIENDEELPPLQMPNQSEDQTENTDDKGAPSDSGENSLDDFIDSYQPILSPAISSYEKRNKTIVELDTMEEFCILIYDEILSVIENMRSVKLDRSSNGDDKNRFGYKENKDGEYHYDENIILNNKNEFELPNGEYINNDDLEEALNTYYRSSKGNKTYIVKSVNRKFAFSGKEKELNNLKSMLKQCSTLKLLKDKKINDSDIKRVYGKERYGTDTELKNLGVVSTPLPEGDYISRDEAIAKLDGMFKSKVYLIGLLGKLKNRLSKSKHHKQDKPIEPLVDEEIYNEILNEQEAEIEKKNANYAPVTDSTEEVLKQR